MIYFLIICGYMSIFLLLTCLDFHCACKFIYLRIPLSMEFDKFIKGMRLSVELILLLLIYFLKSKAYDFSGKIDILRDIWMIVLGIFSFATLCTLRILFCELFFERSFLDKGISMKIVHYTIVDSVVYGLIVFLLFQTNLVYQLVVYLILFSLFQVVVTFGKYNIYCWIDIFFMNLISLLMIHIVGVLLAVCFPIVLNFIVNKLQLSEVENVKEDC